MEFGDYSPPPSPSLEQQRDALQKGLGRAMQWAVGGRLGSGPLLEACLRDRRFDAQVEGLRGGWLWQMVRATGAIGRFRVPVLHALYDLSDEGYAHQLCDLARRYAETGDDTFRARLYEIVEHKPHPTRAWLGEKEVIALDGEPAFLFAARVRGRLLAGREWEWDDGGLVDLAAKRFGEDRVGRLLDAAKDGAVRRFRDQWLDDRRKMVHQQDRPSYQERMAATPVREVLRAAEG